MSDRTIVILAVQKESTNIVYNALKNDFRIEKVIIEEPMPKMQFLERRIEKLGFFKVFGQILFLSMVVPFLKAASRKRIAELKQIFKLDDASIDKSKIINVKSINSDDTRATLKKANPDIVIINGTRIVSEKVLNCIPAKFINMHAGITPAYRGVHGAYWALVERNEKECGVTVHFVDTGIDTGNIIEQGLIAPAKEDNFITYPLLQLGAGIPLLKKAIRDVFENKINVKPSSTGKSRLWSHPTLWEYIWYKVCYNVS